MSCNCTSPSRAPSWYGIKNQGNTSILPGEDVECYMQRANDNVDKSGGVAITDKIENTSITPDCDMKLDMQFKLTEGSTKVATKWRLVNPDDKTQDITISGITFTEAGKMSGTFDPLLEGKKFNVAVIALDSSNEEIDSRSFNFSPKKCTAGSDLVFTHPLPGAIMTSPFGPRKSPTKGASSDHHGVDLAYGGGVTKDVLAACDGIVLKAGVGTGYGNVVYIQHKNGAGKEMCSTRYAHLEKIYVQVGQKVAAGQPIGHEGNTGIGTGKHLHFELRLAGDKAVNPADYVPGLTSKVATAGKTVSGDNDPGKIDGTVTSNTDTSKKGLTTAKVDSINSGCKTPINDSGPSPDQTTSPGDANSSKTPYQSTCRPESQPTVGEVKSKIQAVLDKHGDLDAGDKAFILKTAEIESRFDPYAKNKETSATGLYQFLDKSAYAYYKKIGVEPSCENRCNIEYSTEAMIRFYKDEILRYYNEFKTSYANGSPKMSGKKVEQSLADSYNALSKPVFCYGLIHHDGVGNAIAGVSHQGVQYAKKHFT